MIPIFVSACLSETGIDSLSSEYGAVMPKEEDLHGAALALIRLQDTYNLNVSEMASGQISGSFGYIHMTGTSETKAIARHANEILMTVSCCQNQSINTYA